jgi:hypothetical protein
MEIILKESKTGWIKVNDDISVLVGYPTSEQDIKLKKILYEVGFMPGFDADKIDSLSPADRATVMSLNERYYKQYLKYTIKDWKGVRSENGTEIPCKVVSNELDNELWDKLCRMPMKDIFELVKLIKAETDFTESDKKK